MKTKATLFKVLFLFLVLNIGMCIPMLAQITFEKTYPLQVASVGKSVKQTLDGGYIVAGNYVTKTTDSGIVEWIYPNSADYVNTTSDSGYIVLQNTGNIFFTKLDKLGDTIWRTSYSAGLWAREGNSIEQTDDGGYIVAGRFQDFSGSGMMLLKLNQQGSVSWKKTFWEATSAAFAYGQSVHQTSDGGYIMAGYTYKDYYDSNRHKDVMVVKTDSVGTSQWTKYYGGTSDEYSYSIQKTPNGFIVAGSQYDSATSATNMYLLKLNNLGDTVWTKTYGGNYTSEFKSIGLTTDGGYILTGSSNISTNGGPTNVSVFKLDSAGNTLWTKEFGGNDADAGKEILQTTDGGYILTGVANASTITNGVMFLIKMDSLGNVNAPLSIAPTLARESVLKVYPNPTINTIYIETDLADARIRIFNLEGRAVLTKIIRAGNNEIDMLNLSDGIYIYQILNEVEIIKAGKLLIRNK